MMGVQWECNDHPWEVLLTHDAVKWIPTPFQGFWYSEVQVRRLQIRIVSQSVVCVLSFGPCSSLLV